MKFVKNERYIMSLMMPIVLSLILLSGCSTLPGATVNLDRAPINLRQPCLLPDRLDDSKPMILGDLIQADSDLAVQYMECREKLQGWISWEEKTVGGVK